MRFPPELRIKSSFDFSAARKGKKLESRSFFLYVSENLLNKTRLGLIVSRKVGNSVKRNRVKRILREAFKNCFLDLKCGYDIVVIARPECVDLKLDELIKELSDTLSYYYKNIERRQD